MTMPADDPRYELVEDLVAQIEWRDDAACLDSDPRLFFPTRGEDVDAAKAICATCPVIVACREFAISRVVRQGIYGGMSERERRRERHQRARERIGLQRLADPVVDPVEQAEERLGIKLAESYRCEALWPRRRSFRRPSIVMASVVVEAEAS